MVKLRFALWFFMIATLASFGPGCGPRTIMAAEKKVLVPDEDFQVLTSGPIHEAFAEAVTLDPEPGIVVPKAPPVLIEEIPPEQKPEGDVQWIPGYWAWDDEKNEYIWVSGIWRIPPPGRQWIPGYWNSVTHGYQWISGYWTSVKTEEMEYLPEPPESVEIGPSSNAPSPDYIWIPGCWRWYYGRYAWRPGYWAVANPDWIWVPARYHWTPRGYIFVAGYWDHTIIRRGVLFAPVFFRPRVHLGLTFLFSPGFVINLNIFDDALFVRPRYRHYYYGDYYASRHYRNGIYPWFSLHARRVVYDPIYVYQRWNHRNDRDWEKHLETRFRDRREHKDLRPSRSFNHRTELGKTGGSPGSERLNVVMPLDRVGKTKKGTHRFKSMNEKERKQFLQQKKEVRTYRQERQRRETQRQNLPNERGLQKSEPNKEKFSRSPVMDRSNEKVERKKVPPTRYKAPKPNPNVEPLERKYDSSRFQEKSRKSENIERKSDDRGEPSMDREQKKWNGDLRRKDRLEKLDHRRQGGDDVRKR